MRKIDRSRWIRIATPFVLLTSGIAISISLVGSPALAQSKNNIFQATLEEPNQTSPEISTEQLQKLLLGKAKLCLLDARPKSQYDLAHIAGAINIDDYETIPGRGLEELMANEYPDKAMTVVVYCNGIY